MILKNKQLFVDYFLVLMSQAKKTQPSKAL